MAFVGVLDEFNFEGGSRKHCSRPIDFLSLAHHLVGDGAPCIICVCKGISVSIYATEIGLGSFCVLSRIQAYVDHADLQEPQLIHFMRATPLILLARQRPHVHSRSGPKKALGPRRRHVVLYFLRAPK